MKQSALMEKDASFYLNITITYGPLKNLIQIHLRSKGLYDPDPTFRARNLVTDFVGMFISSCCCV